MRLIDRGSALGADQSAGSAVDAGAGGQLRMMWRLVVGGGNRGVPVKLSEHSEPMQLRNDSGRVRLIGVVVWAAAVSRPGLLLARAVVRGVRMSRWRTSPV